MDVFDSKNITASSVIVDDDYITWQKYITKGLAIIRKYLNEKLTRKSPNFQETSVPSFNTNEGRNSLFLKTQSTVFESYLKEKIEDFLVSVSAIRCELHQVNMHLSAMVANDTSPAKKQLEEFALGLIEPMKKEINQIFDMEVEDEEVVV